MWDIMMVLKAFWKGKGDGFGKNIRYRRGKSISTINIYSRILSGYKSLFFLVRKWFNVANLPPVWWLLMLWNGAIAGGWLGAQCWFSLLADLVLSSSCVQVSFCEWQSMFSSSCTSSISATTASLFMGLLGNDKDIREKKLTLQRMGHFIYMIIELLPN